MRDILLIAGVLGCAVIALRNPVFGILTYLCFSLTNPASFTWGIGHSFPLGAVMAGATIVGLLLWREPRRIPRQRELWLFLALWETYGWSTIFAVYPDFAIDRFEHISKILMMVVVSMILINTENRIYQLVRVIGLSIGVYALGAGIFAIATGFQFMVWGPEDSFLESNNSIGMAFALNAPILYYLAKMENRKWLRFVMVAMFLASYPAVLATFSRGAWLGLGLATAFLVWKSQRRQLIIVLSGIVLMVAIPFMTELAPERVASRMNDLRNYEQESSAQSRFWTWQFCGIVGLSNPLHGAGFDFYTEEMYRTYFPKYLDEWTTTVHSCHSMWLTVLGEHGIVGFAVWLALMGAAALSLYRLRRIGLARSDVAWVVPLTHMFEIAFVVFGLTGLFLDTAYFELYYQMVAVVILMKERVAARVNDSQGHGGLSATLQVPERAGNVLSARHPQYRDVHVF